jgi:hypothetical protein
LAGDQPRVAEHPSSSDEDPSGPEMEFIEDPFRHETEFTEDPFGHETEFAEELPAVS